MIIGGLSPIVSLDSVQEIQLGMGEHTKILNQNFLSAQNRVLLRNQRPPVLQQFLFLGLVEPEAIRVPSTSPFCQVILHILHGGLVCDLDACGEFLDGLFRD